jgi:predicted MFS family arabinose efflux permease
MIPGGLLALWLNIRTGRLSDRIGRRRVIFLMMVVTGAAYATFYSGIRGWIIPPLWITAFFGYFAAASLIRGICVEIVPTAYRATIGGLSYAIEIFAGGILLGLEGVFYDHFHTHGPAIAICLLSMPVALIGVLFLPEPAGKALEDVSHA